VASRGGATGIGERELLALCRWMRTELGLLADPGALVPEIVGTQGGVLFSARAGDGRSGSFCRWSRAPGQNAARAASRYDGARVLAGGRVFAVTVSLDPLVVSVGLVHPEAPGGV